MTYEEAREIALKAYTRQKTEKYTVVLSKAMEVLLFGEYGITDGKPIYPSGE